jgi:predicted amidohydrolase YtcJ
MGDASVKQSANCLAQGQKNAGIKKRNVIAHLMLMDEEDARTMGDAGIIANCQPRWMVYDSDINAMIFLVGVERARSCYPYRMLLQNGVKVAFGTDFPVTPPPSTLHEIQCAMTRSVFPEALDYEQYRGKILGDEKPASLEEAVQSITINGAYQMNMERYTGSIEEGKSAELVILDSNLEEIPVEKIYQVNVVKTIFNGKVVYEKAD